jgi:DNA-binding NtrC family response regulator
MRLLVKYTGPDLRCTHDYKNGNNKYPKSVIPALKPNMNQKSLRILILADDAWHGSMLEQHASLNPEYNVKRFQDAENFFHHLQEQPDVAVIDCPLPGLHSAADVLHRIKSQQPGTQVIIIAGKDDPNASVQLLKQGAFEYIVKGENAEERLWNTLLHVQEIISLRREVAAAKSGYEPFVADTNVFANGLSNLLGREISLREYECQIIQYFLEKYNKDVLLVAKKLDIGKSTIYRMIQNGELRKGVA